jgi:serine/threonine protein kinase
MSSEAERHERIGKLFDAALERPAGERRAFLAQECAGDEELLSAVERLLEHHTDEGSFLDPVLERSHAAALLAGLAGSGGDPVQIGPYRIKQRLGEGGMGTVYLATQAEPIQRNVALKVIKPGMDSRTVIARFESERRALALMAHPNIAQVFEAGTTELGLPYFAMELVDGLPITRYCEENKLGIRERIELFIPVCQAIQHAHQKGIIHRDIKPSNVLVAVQEGRATPKVIDFGLAKALGDSFGGASMMTTHVGTIVGTLQYMSPEQAELGAVDVDTRSDVYSLGALLYELLTGTPPLDSGRIEKETYVAILQRIREEEPKAPSARLRESAAGRPLDSELDWIPMKALEKERVRRYETVSGMVLDLQRYLDGEAVEAAPPSRLYRVGKFVRKHRPWIAATVAILVLLTGGGAFSTWMAVRATRAEQEARAINEFLQRDLLGQAEPTGQKGRPDPQMTVRAALDRAAALVDGRFRDQPQVEASLRNTIGSIYTNLGLHKKGQSELRRAVAMRKTLLGNGAEATITSQRALGANLLADGETAEAETVLTEALAQARSSLARGHEVRLGVEGGLAQVKQTLGRWDEAIALASPAEEEARRTLGVDHERTRDLQYLLFSAHYKKGNYETAHQYLTAALEAANRVDGPEAAGTIMLHSGLAMLYSTQRLWDKAGAEYEMLLAAARRNRGPSHPNTLIAIYNLAAHYMRVGRYSEADALFRENLQLRRALYKPDHPRTLIFMNAWSSFHTQQGKLAEAEAIFAEYMPLLRKALPEDHPTALLANRFLAELRLLQNRATEAETIVLRVIDMYERRLGKGNSEKLGLLVPLARARLQAGRFADAEEPARMASEEWAKLDPDGWMRYHAQMAYGASLAGQGKDGSKELEAGFAGLKKTRALMMPGDLNSWREAERWRANGR